MNEAPLEINIAANRRARKWSTGELLARTVWEIVRTPLFAWTPRPLWGWRRILLRLFGARIGHSVHIFPSVKIALPWNLIIEDEAAIGDGAILYNLGMISIGTKATVSQYAHLCAGTHDYQLSEMPLLKLPISIGAGAWICADAFVGPGITIGAFAVLGARAVAVKDVPDGVIAVGHPARIVGPRQTRSV